MTKYTNYSAYVGQPNTPETDAKAKIVHKPLCFQNASTITLLKRTPFALSMCLLMNSIFQVWGLKSFRN